ncbi:MAG: nuclear transport factor 2 family protein [Solirubrobacterales bacterium]|nr:nuclear transport factor 2 family protein [Solirubrobacterales bacterium]
MSTTAALDGRDLVRGLARALDARAAVSLAPGLVAERDGELVRDAARARGAVVCILAPAGPDLANHALLSVEVARAAGLAVPAVLVVGPGADAQRELVAERGLVDVVPLPDLHAPSAAIAGWPLSEWIAAEPVSTDGGVTLSPYTPWEARAVPDPRTAGREAIGPVLLEIIAAEGPVLASRAYRLYNRAAGGKALTTIARAPLSGSAYRLRQAGAIELDVTPAAGGEEDELLRAAGTPAVRVRELGPRTLDEVPQAELVALMERLLAVGLTEDQLPRATLDTYGLVRMTAKAETALRRAAALAAGTA